MTEIALIYGVDGKQAIRLRSLTGAGERSSAGDAHGLLRRLALEGPGLVAGGAIDRLPLCDRDQALAALYGAFYGDTVIADASCGGCKVRFELRFSMADLASSQQPASLAKGDPPTVEAGGREIRLPAAADLAALGPGARPSELLTRLAGNSKEPWAESEITAVSEALERTNPLIDLDLDSPCPECGKENSVRFVLTEFLGACLARDEEFLLREIHLLARSYGWSFESLTALTRSERQTFVRLVLAEQTTSATPRRIA